jgi:8-oxo-dGTP pyrophosphatase MutT (NUDIX family)
MNLSIGTIFFSTSTKRYLFLLRNKDSHGDTWAFVGGKVESGESPIEGLTREIEEEVGFLPNITKNIPIEKFTNKNKQFEYHTFISVVEEEFIPKLNKEHKGYAWVSIEGWPKPLHPGVFSTFKIEEIMGKIKTVSELFVDSA